MSETPKHTTEAQHDPDKVKKPNADQLRAEIDAGMTDDKDAHSDPSAAPLGADAEAGGDPNGPEAVQKARQEEVRKGSED